MNLIPVALAAAEEEPLVPTFVSNVAVGLIALVATFFLATFLKAWIQRVVRAKQGEEHEEARVLYGRMVFTITLAIGITISLILMGVPLEWFSGGVGLGVAFALRGFIANFFAGVILLSNKKFNLGDFVVVEPDTMGKSAVVGRIVDIQSRATSIRAIDGGEVTIPNLRLIESAVKCYTKNPIRRHSIEISVGFGSNLHEVAGLIEKTIAANSSVQPEPQVTVLVKEIGENAVLLKARFWTESRVKWWIIKSEITREVFDALRVAKVDIPHPIRTLRIDEPSSDLLAKDPHFLEKLEKIEENKKAHAPKNIFTKTPSNS